MFEKTEKYLTSIVRHAKVSQDRVKMVLSENLKGGFYEKSKICFIFISMLSFTAFSQKKIVCNENNYEQYIHVVGVKCDLRGADLRGANISRSGESPIKGRISKMWFILLWSRISEGRISKGRTSPSWCGSPRGESPRGGSPIG